MQSVVCITVEPSEQWRLGASVTIGAAGAVVAGTNGKGDSPLMVSRGKAFVVKDKVAHERI